MADLFAVDLALDLSPTTPASVIEQLRRHLDAGSAEEPDDDCEVWAPGFTPLLAERGPAWRIGGVLTGELVRGEDRWSLTARQEIHAELRPELDELAEMLAHHARTPGVIGQVRWYEDHFPELLVSQDGKLVKIPLHAAD
jgi:hypothetical protein